MREPVTMIAPSGGAPALAGAFWPWVLMQVSCWTGSVTAAQSTAVFCCCACCCCASVWASAGLANAVPSAIADTENENREKFEKRRIAGIPFSQKGTDPHPCDRGDKGAPSPERVDPLRCETSLTIQPHGERYAFRQPVALMQHSSSVACPTIDALQNSSRRLPKFSSDNDRA